MAVETLEPDTFPKLLLRHARDRGERPAIRVKSRGIWRTTTWRALADEAAALAGALAARGLQRGAHVAFLGGNRPRLYAAMCATQWLGGVVVPLYQEATASEIAPLLKRAEITHIFVEDQEQADKVLEVLPSCPTLRWVIYDKDRGMRHYRLPQLLPYADLLQDGRDAAAAKNDFLQAEVGRGAGTDVASVVFTSATTGSPKGVILTHAALIDRARSAASSDGLSETDVALAFLPPAWIGQNLFGYAQPLVTGHCICCPESAETMFADLREIGPTYFLAPPSVLEAMFTRVSLEIEDTGYTRRKLYRTFMALARHVGARIVSRQPVFIGSRLTYALGDPLIYGPLRDMLGLSRVRVAYTTGEGISPNLLMFFRSIGINLKQLYGSTEAGFFVAMHRNGDVKPDTVGIAAQGVELDMTPEREILVRSPGLFSGYHGDPGATTQAMTPEGWYRTGDSGYLGEDGHLRIVDRMINMGALSGGTPLAPSLLESKIKSSPYIKEAVAFGDGRNMVCMLVDIDTAAVGSWADKQAISYTGHADLASRDEVAGLIADAIEEVNAELAQDPILAKAQVRRFVILTKELNADDGVLTRMRKVRRAAVSERYRDLVAAMYDGLGSVQLAEQAASADGALAPAIVHVHDATNFAPRKAKRAA